MDIVILDESKVNYKNESRVGEMTQEGRVFAVHA